MVTNKYSWNGTVEPGTVVCYVSSKDTYVRRFGVHTQAPLHRHGNPPVVFTFSIVDNGVIMRNNLADLIRVVKVGISSAIHLSATQIACCTRQNDSHLVHKMVRYVAHLVLLEAAIPYHHLHNRKV